MFSFYTENKLISGLKAGIRSVKERQMFYRKSATDILEFTTCESVRTLFDDEKFIYFFFDIVDLI